MASGLGMRAARDLNESVRVGLLVIASAASWRLGTQLERRFRSKDFETFFDLKTSLLRQKLTLFQTPNGGACYVADSRSPDGENTTVIFKSGR